MRKLIFKKELFNGFAIGAVLIIIAILIGYYFQYTNHKERYVTRVQNELSEKSDLLEEHLKRLAKVPVEELFNTALDKELCEMDVYFLAYLDNNLIYWSNNTTPVDYIYDSVLFSQGFIQLENGYYLVKTLSNDTCLYVGLLTIKRSYKYENEYIKNEFNKCFDLPDGTRIGFERNQLDIFDKAGKYLFSLVLPEENDIKDSFALLLLALYLAALLFVVVTLYQIYLTVSAYHKEKKWFFALFVAFVVILRVITFYFTIPEVLYSTKLFGPSYLAISGIVPSLGDLIVNAAMLLIIAWYFFSSFRFNLRPQIPQYKKLVTAFTLIFHVFIFFHIYQLLFNRIVFDSVISFNLGNVFGISVHGFLGFLVIAALLFAFFLISARLCMAAFEIFPEKKHYVLLIVGTTMIASIVSILRNHFDPATILFLFFYILTFVFIGKLKSKLVSFAWVIFYLVAFALITTYSLQKLNTRKEKQERKLIALELASDRDKVAEYQFSIVENEIYNDTVLIDLLSETYNYPELEAKATDHIITTHFGRYWANYQILATICYPGKLLHIRPGDYIIECRSYFEGYIQSLGDSTESKSLFYIFPGANYLARFEFSVLHHGFENPVTVYIEIDSKTVTKGLGYPELLLDGASEKSRDLYNYSYANFINGELASSAGKYTYTFKDAGWPTGQGSFTYFDRNKFNHLLYNTSPDRQLVVSLPKPGFLDLVAPFSYLFIFFGLFVFSFRLIVGFPYRLSFSEISFRNRIQYSMFGIVLISFLIIGVSTLFFISRLNHNKNISILSEKSHSVLIELEHKLVNVDRLDNEIRGYLGDLLTKFSLVFFTDINLYDPQGWLLASSRSQIFEEGLVSDRMNPEAYKQLAIQNKASFIQNESIGSYDYLSAYLPLRNDQNNLIGFVNLPYFARQSELRQEISSFLVTFTNIYVILMAIGLFLALLLSDYLLRPLMILKANIRKVKLSESTQKIEWKGKDEISELIEEYNRMTGELVRSAELLARSERESAWREMARQVAHEIKNPLTPMKLSVQHLQKAWNEKASDWDGRLQKFTQTLTQQIDSLSEIASAFSDFATMPVAAHERVNLKEIISNVAVLYNDLENITIQTNFSSDDHACNVLADKKQILRIFNNLVQNSVQAIGIAKDGLIQIEINTENSFWLVAITDNGGGISPELEGKIFSPYFTTKSSGMGLGLAIVQNIISGIGGSISFKSSEKTGTTFELRFPILDESIE
ncbi:MAG: GHKL domain-containing protein [Bacteroidales bacterium]|nr:GHKL domain-containing protein [Bacteroidales bacterium]